jgi:hypothetical protein
MNFGHALASLVCGPLLLASLHAQDLLGVAYDGAVVRIDSYTGQVTALGTGLAGQNALARSATGVFWSTRRTTQLQYDFTTIDPMTGAATVAFNGQDIRALAQGVGADLYGIRYLGNTCYLVRVDTAGGVAYLVGPTGFAGVQGLTLHQGVLCGWDVFAGLVVVDPVTGAATDPFPGVGGPAYQQSLCSHPDGRLLLGGGDSNGPDQLFTIDPATGTAQWIADLNGVRDLRGMEPIGGFAPLLGPGCQGVGGTVQLAVSGWMRGGGTIVASSNNHESNALGALVFGLSTTNHLGQPLPWSPDAMFGTVQCNLYTSIDVHLFGITSAAAPATLQYVIALPPFLAGTRFHLQHVCFEPVAGGMSWSSGRSVQVQ